jgi:ectoine hydroxylase-related dioxygenase (phytanoyl-CoA dioxygenase family)
MKPTVLLNADQIAHFREHGYVALDRISPPEEVERLRLVFDRLFSTRAGWEKGAQLDLAGTDEEGKPAALPQILNPQEFAPELRETEFRENALAIARQLLGQEANFWFEHAIMKPAQVGAATPWHQDEAHRDDPGVEYDQISIWMPLQEAHMENGCMKYIAGSQRGPVLEHRSPNNDPRVTALECVGGFEPEDAVACPLPPGGAAIHHCRTLHCAGPNISGDPRRAYILAFRGPDRPSANREPFPWNAQKRTAAQARHEAWEKRGGVIGRAARIVAAAAGGAVRRARGAASRMLRG